MHVWALGLSCETRRLWGPHPSPPPTLRPPPHPSGPHPFGAPPFLAPTLSGPPPFRGPHPFGAQVSGPQASGPTLGLLHPKGPHPCGPKIQHLVIGRSRIGRSRPRSLETARARKERRHQELSGQFGRSRLVVLACEVGGRWSEETRDFLRHLAKARARGEPNPLQRRAEAAWLMRWRVIMACRAAKSCALSLLDLTWSLAIPAMSQSASSRC